MRGSWLSLPLAMGVVNQKSLTYCTEKLQCSVWKCRKSIISWAFNISVKLNSNCEPQELWHFKCQWVRHTENTLALLGKKKNPTCPVTLHLNEYTWTWAWNEYAFDLATHSQNFYGTHDLPETLSFLNPGMTYSVFISPRDPLLVQSFNSALHTSTCH